MIRAFVFDFDGLIMDSEYPRYMGWKRAYAMYGCELTPEDYARCVGRGDGQFDFRADLEARANASIDWPQLDRERQDLRLSLLAQERDLPGVRALVLEALRTGIRIGIASSSPRRWVCGQLERLSMRDYFECIVTGDDVVHTKPDPACYVKALEHLGSPHTESVAFEDSPVGCRAALDAGLNLVVVTNRITRNLEFPRCALHLESLAKVRIADILALFD